jgi:hypothetical protein
VASWVCASSIFSVKVFTFMIVETIIVYMLGVLCELLSLAILPFQCMTSDRQYSKHAWTQKKKVRGKTDGRKSCFNLNDHHVLSGSRIKEPKPSPSLPPGQQPQEIRCSCFFLTPYGSLLEVV